MKPACPGDHDRLVCEAHAPPFRCLPEQAQTLLPVRASMRWSLRRRMTVDPDQGGLSENLGGDTVSRSNRAEDGISRVMALFYDRKASPMRVRARAEQMISKLKELPSLYVVLVAGGRDVPRIRPAARSGP